MLRLHFTAEDLLDTAFATAPAPLLETSLAVAQLQRRDGGGPAERWRQTHRQALPRVACALLELIQPSGDTAEFLDQLGCNVDEGIDLMRSFGAPRAELLRVSRQQQPSQLLKGLATGDGEAWSVIDGAVRSAYATLVQPTWQRLEGAFRAEVAYRGALLVDGGLGATLTSLFPGSRWDGAVLEVDEPHPGTVLDYKLNGRGLLLQPSVLWTGGPLRAAAPDGRLILTYAAAGDLACLGDPVEGDPLAELLGRTRASVLRQLTEPHTTTQLASRLRISAASASEHAKALRRAGLVQTQRVGIAVHHVCTSLGRYLVATPPQ